MKQRTPTARHWPCVFSTKSILTEDETVDKMWKKAFGERTPFGDLRNQFRRQHCRTLNPYGSDTCPYAEAACARAFYKSILVTVRAHPKVPVGYFRKVAKTEASIRADEKPLARYSTKVLTGDREGGSLAQEGGTSGLGHAVPAPANEGQRVRSTTSGPVGIGDVLRSLDLRPREPRDHEGQEGSE